MYKKVSVIASRIEKNIERYRKKNKKNIESKNPNVARRKNGKVMFLSKCLVCDSKKSKFIKEQKASRLLSSLGIKSPLSIFL